MPVLQIQIHDQVWPDVLLALTTLYGPVPQGVQAKHWAEQIAAQVFADECASVAKPAPKTAPRRHHRPSQART